jgi:hypothetical protein
MTYVTIPTPDVTAGKPTKASTGIALRDNPLAIAQHDDGGENAPRIHCDAAAGNASALASTAAAGSVLRVSSTPSPDGHGNLVVPEDLASGAPSVIHSAGTSIVLLSGRRYMIHAHALDAGQTAIGCAYFNGSSIARQSTVRNNLLPAFDPTAFSLSGLTLSFSTGGLSNSFLIAHEVVGPV